MKTLEVWHTSLSDAQQTLQRFSSSKDLVDKCVEFSRILTETYQRGGTVFSCGNGGSHCDAMHFAEEMTGKYRKERRPLGALALGDAAHVTCTANDYGFDHIFERQLRGLARKGDALIGLSTSGNSKNVINAVKAAKEIGLKTVGLLGRNGGELKGLVDIAIVVPAETSDRIQEIHIKLIHTVIETVERELFPENYRG
jgi:D-sedoheptulose 7-phosphate isomerase